MKFLQLVQLAAAAVPFTSAWKNVRIGGGGGFIPGIVFHPTADVAYARTDIGGIYRLNSDDSWTPLQDFVADHHHWGRWGVDAIALDPQDGKKVYCAVGMYTNDWDPNMGAIMRSNNRGETWEFTDLPFKVGGNMPGRGMGERLAVDPANSKIIYFGARSGNGLWKSTDGGVSFSKVSSFTWPGTFIPDPSGTGGYNNDIQGLAFITFDETSGTKGGATSRIFVGTADLTTSVYVSEDAGASWKAVAGQPTGYLPHKCKLQPTEKALYLSYSDGSGPYDGSKGSVWRYDITASTWTDITPVSGSDLYFGFGGLAVDIQNPGTIMVVSLNSWWPDAQFFRSTDSGASWSKIWEWTSYPNQNWYYGLNTDKAPWINTGFTSTDTKRLGWMTEALEINPRDSDHWLYGTGLTLYGGHDLTNWDDPAIRNVSIASLADGIEEFAVLGLASAPGGSELLAAVGDDSGFTFRTAGDLDTAPDTPWMTPIWTSSTSVDYAGNNVDSLVRAGNTEGSQMLALSYNGGQTWNINWGADTSTHSGQVAYSADADTIVWSSGNNGVKRTQYTGALTSVVGLPAGAVIASDKSENDYFYGAHGSTFYVSSDRGITFAPAGKPGDAAEVRDIACHPDNAGELWVSTDVGIFRSTDFGATFVALGAAVTNTYQVALGKGKTDYVVYTFGSGPTGEKLYATVSDGSHWLDIQENRTFGAIDSARLAGSMNVAGQVYVGTNGRGVFYHKRDM